MTILFNVVSLHQQRQTDMKTSEIKAKELNLKVGDKILLKNHKSEGPETYTIEITKITDKRIGWGGKNGLAYSTAWNEKLQHIISIERSI